MNYSGNSGGGGYHELQNIVKGVPIQCMVIIVPYFKSSVGSLETKCRISERGFKNQWE